MRRSIRGFFAASLVLSFVIPGRNVAQEASPAAIIESPKIPPPPAAPSAKPSAAPASPAASPAPAATPAPTGEPLLTFQADTTRYATSAEVEGVLLSIESLKTRVESVENKLRELEATLKSVQSTADTALRSSRSGGGGSGSGSSGGSSSAELGQIKQKLTELSNRFKDHTHEVMVEVRDRSGGITDAPQGGLQGGQSATGRVKVGKPR